MPSVSKAQQRFMGLVHAYKKGEVPASKVSQAVKDAAKSMKKKSTKKFASTKHKGLPNKVRSENMNEDGHTDVASAERKLKLIIKDAMDTINALKNLSNEDSLPSWWTDKITLAKDYVGKSRDYIMNPAESVNEISAVAFQGLKDSKGQMWDLFWREKPPYVIPFNARGPKTKVKDITDAKLKKTILKVLKNFKNESVNEDITTAGYFFIRKAAYGIGVALKDLNKGITRQNDKMVLNEIDYIYDKVIDMKRMLKNKRYNESVNEAVEPQGNIKKVLDVAKNKQAKKIGGTLVDGTTANMMTQVWNKVNDTSKEKMNKMNTKQLINLILRMWKAMGTPRV